MSEDDLRQQYSKAGLVYYTPAEEAVHTVSHLIGVLGAALAFALALVRKLSAPSLAYVIVSSLLWAIQFGISAAYHGARHIGAKRVLRHLDYAAVSLNVIACGAAFCLLYGSVYGYVALGVSVALTIGVLALCLVRFDKYKRVAVAAAFAVGALMFGAFWSAYCSPAGIVNKYPVVWYHLAGLLTCLVGAAIFGVHKRWAHAVFHILVLIGPALCAVGNYYQLT